MICENVLYAHSCFIPVTNRVWGKNWFSNLENSLWNTLTHPLHKMAASSQTTQFTISIGLDNGLVPNRRQVIVWTKADMIDWRTYAALDGNYTNVQYQSICVTISWSDIKLTHVWTGTWMAHPCIIHCHRYDIVLYTGIHPPLLWLFSILSNDFSGPHVI